MSVRFRSLAFGIAAVGFGIALLGLASPVNSWFEDAQLGGAMLAIISGLYAILVSSWRESPTDMSSPSLFTLIRRDLRKRPFRTISQGIGVAVIVGVLFTTTLLINGAPYSIQTIRNQIGGDLMIVPLETAVSSEAFYALPYAPATSGIGSVANPSYINQSVEQTIGRIPGVEQVASQLLVTYYSTIDCGSLDSVYIVAVSQSTDFTIDGLIPKAAQSVGTNGAVFGAEVPSIDLLPNQGVFFGIKLQSNVILPRTGTYIDHVIFISMQTAERMWQAQSQGGNSVGTGLQPISFQPGQVSAIFVKLNQSAVANNVALQIQSSVPRVRAYTFNSLVNSTNMQFAGLLSVFALSEVVVWGGFILLGGTIAFLAVNQRRSEMGVIRALGASGGFIMKLIALQTILVTSVASLLGIFAAWIILSFPALYDSVMLTFKIPYLVPPAGEMGFLALILMEVSVAIGAASSLWPARIVSRMEPYDAIRTRGQ